MKCCLPRRCLPKQAGDKLSACLNHGCTQKRRRGEALKSQAVMEWRREEPGLTGEKGPASWVNTSLSIRHSTTYTAHCRFTMANSRPSASHSTWLLLTQDQNHLNSSQLIQMWLRLYESPGRTNKKRQSEARGGLSEQTVIIWKRSIFIRAQSRQRCNETHAVYKLSNSSSTCRPSH